MKCTGEMVTAIAGRGKGAVLHLSVHFVGLENSSSCLQLIESANFRKSVAVFKYITFLFINFI